MQLSYILPFYRKAKAFRKMLPLNDCFKVKDVEVVLALDEPTEEREILGIVAANPDIKFRVIVNDWEHTWRPPCMAYNVGIRHALADHVVLTEPECAVVMPSADLPLQLVRQDFRMCYAGILWDEYDIADGDSVELMRQKLTVCEAINKVWMWGHGFLLAPKIALERICGFDESRDVYGLDDDDVRIRLSRLGYKCTIDGRIKVFHSSHTDTNRHGNAKQSGPEIALTQQQESWGKAYNRVAYSWDKL